MIQDNSTLPKITNILIDLTNICNYKCKFCWYHGNQDAEFLRTYTEKAHFFPFARLVPFIDDLKIIGAKQITLTSEGEPTMHPDFSKIVKHIKDTGIILKLQTNGSFGHALRETVQQVDEIFLQFSFVSEKSFAALNKNAVNKKNEVLDNIRYLKNQTNRPRLNITYILNRINMHELEEAVACFNEAGVDSVQFKLVEIVAGVNEDLMFTKEDANLLSRILLTLKKDCRFATNIMDVVTDLTKHFYGSGHFSKNPKITFDFCWKDWKEQRPEVGETESDYIMRSKDLTACFYPLKYLYLRLNGELYSCPRNSWIPPMGNIYKDSVIDILKSHTYKELVKNSIYHFDTNKPEWIRCKNCFDPEYHRKMKQKMDLVKESM